VARADCCGVNSMPGVGRLGGVYVCGGGVVMCGGLGLSGF